MDYNILNIIKVLDDLNEINRSFNLEELESIKKNNVLSKIKKIKHKKAIKQIKKYKYNKNSKQYILGKLPLLNPFSLEFLENRFYIKHLDFYNTIVFSILKKENIEDLQNKFNLSSLEAKMLSVFLYSGYEGLGKIAKEDKDISDNLRKSLLILVLLWDFFENHLYGVCFSDTEVFYILADLLEKTDEEKLKVNYMSIGVDLDEEYEKLEKEEKKLYKNIEKILNEK